MLYLRLQMLEQLEEGRQDAVLAPLCGGMRQLLVQLLEHAPALHVTQLLLHHGFLAHQ